MGEGDGVGGSECVDEGEGEVGRTRVWAAFAHHGGGERLSEAQAQNAAVRALRRTQDAPQRVALLLRRLLLRRFLPLRSLALLL